MRDLSAALYQPRHHIILKREALLLHITKGKLFEAVVSEVLTRHEVKDLVCHFRLAVQSYDFKALDRLPLVCFLELHLKLVFE